jgi:hypothetical protein
MITLSNLLRAIHERFVSTIHATKDNEMPHCKHQSSGCNNFEDPYFMMWMDKDYYTSYNILYVHMSHESLCD